jgi:hypothetical protein
MIIVILRVVNLAAEFIHNTLAIVIIGLLSSEYILCRCKQGGAKTKRVLLILLAIALLGSAMILFEFFIGRGAILPKIFIYIPGISLLLYLAFLSRRLSPVGSAAFHFRVFVGATAAILVLSALHVFIQGPLITFASNAAQVVAVAGFYFYTISF